MTKRLVTRRTALGSAAGLLTISSLANRDSWILASELIAENSFESAKESKETGRGNQSYPIRILLNENPLGCSPSALESAQQVLSRANYYPYDLMTGFANKLRTKHGLPLLEQPKSLSSKIIPDTNSHALSLAGGSSELLHSAAIAFCMEGGNIVEADPSYQALGAVSQARPGPSVALRRIPLRTDGGLDTSAMLSAIDRHTRIVVITNPNNPTGTAENRSDLQTFVTSIPESTVVLIDEAYIDFLSEPESHSLIPLALQRQNVLITRTFSKIHGLAGLRIGYAVGHRSLLEKMQPFRVGSFSMNVCGIAAASASLDDAKFQEKSRSMAADSRRRIAAELVSLGFQVPRSDAACIWADWGRDATGLVEKLATEGILIASGLRWNRPSCIRISVATEWQTDRLLDALSRFVRHS